MSATRRHYLIPGVLLLAALALAGCGGPAPGEGVKQPLMRGPAPELVSLGEAVQAPDITAIDPQTMHQAEIEKALGAGPYCAFAYTAESPPVLAFKAAEGVRGVIKIHGRLVMLGAEQAQQPATPAQGVALSTEGGRVEVRVANGSAGSGGEPQVADMLFELEQGLRVGYRGWYRCAAQTPPGEA